MKLCLNSIVKNESARIERMLDSVISHIDCAVIVDTGSTDDTVAKIKAYFEAAGKPYEIGHAEFKDWAQARNAALAAAHQSDLEFDMLLLVDADMELRVTDPKWLEAVTGPAYTMAQEGGGIYYQNARMLSRYAPAEYVGVTHEYLSTPSIEVLSGAHFADHADGANRPQKFQRDIALLTRALRDDTLSEGLRGRYLFYLAQSYRDAGEHKNALEAYRERLAIGGWDEELFFSRYYMAYCHRHLGDDPGFVSGLLDAFNMRACRAEPLYDLAHHFRLKGQNALGVLFAESAKNVPPTGDSLFVARAAYEHGPTEELSICGFYSHDPKIREAGFRAANELSLSAKVSEGTRSLARTNLFHYIKTLGELTPCAHHRLLIPTDPGWTPLNPSIANINGQLKCVIRTVNYCITEEGHYVINGKDGRVHYDEDNPIDTRNFLVDLDGYNPTNPREIIFEGRSQPAAWGLVRGFEDMRLFDFANDLYVSATVREMNDEGWAEQVLARLARAGDSYVLTDIRRMTPEMGRLPAEKNWMPFLTGDPDQGMQFVYRAGALIYWNGKFRVNTPPPDIDVVALSGGSQAIRIPGRDQYLAIVHEARALPNGKRYYWHRFIVLDKRGQLRGYTQPFVFQDKQIEFCAGMALHPDGEQLVISYGIRDREAWLAVADLQAVLRAFDGAPII